MPTSSALNVPPAALDVVYRDGGVLSQAQFVVVFWGSNVAPDVQDTTAATYRAIRR